MFVEQAAIGQALGLQIAAAGVGGAAQQDQALAVEAHVGLDRVQAHERRQRDGVGAVAHKGLAGVLLGSGADVAALGVQDHRHAGGDVTDVGHQPFELVFGALGREVGDLRLEGTGHIGRGVDDGRAEVEDARRIAAPLQRKPGWLGVEPHAQHRAVAGLRLQQLIAKTDRHCQRLASGSASPV